jgi:hypothetical protein
MKLIIIYGVCEKMCIYIYISIYIHIVKSRDSAVGIATGYRLDDQGIGIRVPVGQKFSFLYVVQTGSGAHPASYRIGTGGSSPVGKVAGA